MAECGDRAGRTAGGGAGPSPFDEERAPDEMQPGESEILQHYQFGGSARDRGGVGWGLASQLARDGRRRRRGPRWAIDEARTENDSSKFEVRRGASARKSPHHVTPTWSGRQWRPGVSRKAAAT